MPHKFKVIRSIRMVVNLVTVINTRCQAKVPIDHKATREMLIKASFYLLMSQTRCKLKKTNRTQAVLSTYQARLAWKDSSRPGLLTLIEEMGKMAGAAK